MKLVTAFKHLFIPHEHNDYKPHFFRELSVAILIVGSIFMLGFSAGSSFFIRNTVLGAQVTANVLVDLTNESRLAFNESPLVRNPVLDRAASMKAEDMATVGYFAHNSPSGITPWHWFREAGYSFLYAGENLAINFIDADEVMKAWLQSPTHRANLLNVKFKEIGMATVSGVYKDGPSIYVVQMFGTPAKASASVVTARATTTDGTMAQDVVPESEKAEKVTMVSAPEIKGETAGSVVLAQSASSSAPYESVIDTPELAIVKNTENLEPATQEASPKAYSTWYERFLFGSSYYVDTVYRALIAFVLIALLTMIFVEIRKQHWRHIVYGVSVLVVLSLSLFINQTFF